MRTTLFSAILVSLFMVSMAGTGVNTECSALPPEGAAPGKEMPDLVVLGSISDTFEPVKFDHEEHVDMADSCGECHHQHGTDKGISCRECHKIDPTAFKKSVGTSTFSPCSQCHDSSYKADNPGMPGLKAAYHRACFGCHREVNDVGKDPKGCTNLCHERKKQAVRTSDGPKAAH